MSWVVAWSPVACAFVAAACYGPSAGVGVPCGPNGECPSGQHCDYTVAPAACALHDARPVDAPPDAPPTCTASSDCPAAAPYCDTGASLCRGCQADSECGADLCMESTGQCANAANALFVSPTGASALGCPRTAPCSFASALLQVANNRKLIAVLDGTYTQQWNIGAFDANALTISGPDRDPAQVIVRPGAAVAGMIVENTGKPVFIEGVSFTGGMALGIDNRGSLELYRVLVQGNASHGIESRNSGTLTLSECVIHRNMQLGLFVNGTTFELRRSLVVENLQGGVDHSGAGYVFVNNAFLANGTSTSNVGAVRLTNIGGTSPQMFAFNTLANNNAGTSNARTMSCAGAGVAIDSSIFVGALPTIDADCHATYSMFRDETPPGDGNVKADPMFMSSTDLHLSATSPAIDLGNPGGLETTDFDGQPRPHGTRRDIGADEHY